MNYAKPENAPLCRCKDKAVLTAMFCPTGHITECHFPLNCRQAACSHLPRYEEELEPQDMARLEEVAENTLSHLADPFCDQCDGAGRSDLPFTVELPDMPPILGASIITFTAVAICPCVADITRRLQG